MKIQWKSRRLSKMISNKEIKKTKKTRKTRKTKMNKTKRKEMKSLLEKKKEGPHLTKCIERNF